MNRLLAAALIALAVACSSSKPECESTRDGDGDGYICDNTPAETEAP